MGHGRSSPRGGPNAVPPTISPVSAVGAPTTPPSASVAGLPDAQSAGVPQVDGYRVTAPLGAGGMGMVWRAVQLGTQREVALKLMGAAMFGSERARLRFDREVELTARLEHPHIARVYDSGLHAGVYFYAMELIDGGLPLDRFVRERRLGRAEILRLMRTIVSAVEYAHQRGIIHRDLKPANILVTPDGQPHVLDFGLARPVDSSASRMTIDGELAGTPEYMSPEQAAGRSGLDTRTDVYSLGAILFELLTGRLPHDTSGAQLDVLQRISNEEPARPRLVDPTIDADLEALLLKALALRPEDRYASAGELGRDLENYLSFEPLLARRATTWYFLRKRIRRHRLPLAVAGGVLLLLMAVGLYSAVRIRGERDVAVANADRAVRGEKAAVAQTRLARQRLMEGLVFAGDSLARSDDHAAARRSYEQARALALELGSSPLIAETGLLESLSLSPPALLSLASAAPVAPVQAERGDTVMAVAISPDARQVLVGTQDGALRLVDLRTGVQVHAFRPGPGASAAAFCPDGQTAITGHANGHLRFWRLRDGALLMDLPAHNSRVMDLVISRSGDRALTASTDNTMRLWDLRNRRSILAVRAHHAACFSVTFTADEQRAVTGGLDYRINVWDLQTGRNLRTFAARQVVPVRLRMVGEVLVSADSDSHLRTWDIASGRLIQETGGHAGGLAAMEALPGGQRVLTSSGGGLLRLWDVSGAKLIRTIGSHETTSAALAISADGTLALSGGPEGGAVAWSLSEPSGNVAFRQAPDVRSVGYSPDGRIVFSSDDSAIQLWDSATGKLLRTLSGYEDLVMSVAWSADAATLVSGSWDGAVRVYEAGAGGLFDSPPQILRGEGGRIWCVDCTRDGGTIAAACADGQMDVWQRTPAGWPDHPRRLRAHDGRAITLALSPDGRQVLTGGDDHTVRLFDLASGGQLQVMSGHDGLVRCVAFMPDGKSAISGSFDRTVRRWDLGTGREMWQATGHDGYVKAVCAAPDASMILSAGDDYATRLWDPETGRAIRAFEGGARLTSAAFAPNGGAFLAGAEGGVVRRWALDSPSRYREFQPKLQAAHAALSKQADDAESLLTYARWYAFRERFDWAIDLYAQARAAGAAVPSIEIARCYWELDQLAPAAKAFEAALAAREAPEAYLRLCLSAIRSPPEPPARSAPSAPGEP